MAESGAMSQARFATFAEFFPFYLREHSHPLNRWLHFIGTSGAVAIAGAALATGNLLLLPVAPVVGYGFAWIGHFFVEGNKPASFKYPLWSFIGDFKMYGMMLTGRV